MIAKYFLDKKAKMILYLDFWSVHRGQPFRDWLSQNHPELILLFVPANCTGIFSFPKIVD